MRKVISTIGIFFVLLLLYCAPALAATVTITTEPAEITALGNITVRFSVWNESSLTMSDMRIRGYGISDTDNSLRGHELPPSQEIKFSAQNVPVTADRLGTMVVYTFYWTEGGVQKSKETALTLGSATAPPAAADMTGSRTASKNTGKQGDKITLTYTLKNPGTVQMTDVTIKDAIAGDSAIKSGLVIEAGGTVTATYEYTLSEQDAVSEPVITYKVNGESKSLRLDKLTLAVKNLKLTNTVTMGDPTAEGVLFTIVLKNTGNQTVSAISVKDDQGNAVNADAITLQPGQENLLSYTVSASATRVVSFTITGKDETGQPYEDKTNSFEVRPYVDPSQVSFQLFTHVIDNLDENGNMKIRFTIQNSSSVELTGAVITEKILGEVIPSMGVLQVGETVKEASLRVGEPRELEFTVTAKDASGVDHSYTSTLTASIVAIATPTPPPVEETEEPAAPSGGMSNTLVTVLIVLAILMAVAGIALLILSIYERKRNAEMDALDADGYARAPRAQGAAAATRAERRKERKKQKLEDEYFDEDDYLVSEEEVPNLKAPVAQETIRVQDRQPVQTVIQEAKQPAPTYSYAAPARKPDRQPKPTMPSQENTNYRQPLSAVTPTVQPVQPEKPVQSMPPVQPPQPRVSIRPEPFVERQDREPVYSEPAYNEPANAMPQQPLYAQQYEVNRYENVPAYMQNPQSNGATPPLEAPKQPTQPPQPPLYNALNQPTQLPQYTPPPAPPTMDWPEQEAVRPRQAVEPPISQPPAPISAVINGDSASAEAQKAGTQASLGVRSRIHRVRPIDDNKQ